MKIAVIGAGISGLAAGRVLAQAGHEVVVFEKSGGYGGRLASRRDVENESLTFDHGVTHFSVTNPEFQSLVDELTNKGVLKAWEGSFKRCDSDGNLSSMETPSTYFIAPAGMNAVGKYLGRNLDTRLNTKVSGLTHIGENRRVKRSWMLNFPTALTESADAVIISAPARQAYGLLNTTIDEIETLKLVREIDEVEYESQFSLMVHFENGEQPDWNALECTDEIIEWISNENSKRDEEAEGLSLVVQTTSEFAKEQAGQDRESVTELILDRLAKLLGGWAALPDSHQLQYWKYSRAVNPLPYDFMEIKGNDTPLALVGAYMKGNTVESAYLSGLKLGQHWAEQYKD
jgi:predicted NAD/FAD-dependent oxidoreductase